MFLKFRMDLLVVAIWDVRFSKVWSLRVKGLLDSSAMNSCARYVACPENFKRPLNPRVIFLGSQEVMLSDSRGTISEPEIGNIELSNLQRSSAA